MCAKKFETRGFQQLDSFEYVIESWTLFPVSNDFRIFFCGFSISDRSWRFSVQVRGEKQIRVSFVWFAKPPQLGLKFSISEMAERISKRDGQR